MSKLDENLEALHRKVDAHLEQLAFRRRAIAEAAHSAEPSTAIPEQEEPPEAPTKSGAEPVPSETPHPPAAPSPQLRQPIEAIDASKKDTSLAERTDEERALKPAGTSDHETPQPSAFEQGRALPEEGQHAIHLPATDGEVKASLGFFGKIFRRLRWW